MRKGQASAEYSSPGHKSESGSRSFGYNSQRQTHTEKSKLSSLNMYQYLIIMIIHMNHDCLTRVIKLTAISRQLIPKTPFRGETSNNSDKLYLHKEDEMVTTMMMMIQQQ